ncbi:MAG: methionyl-tRNA formyltransferase [Novosphingobium sp.]
MRIIFMGTPDFAVPALKALAQAGHHIAACYTQPPRPAGRGKQLQPSPVQHEAEAMGIAVRHPVSLKGSEAQTEFAALCADIGVVAAYGLILPQAVLDAPRLGCLNVHGSLLPRWRGAAPVQRAILAGDLETGITIMRMEAGLDTGPMLAAERCRIGCLTAGELTSQLADIGARLMVAVLADISRNREIPQPEVGVTYASKIDKSEARLNFAQSAEQVERQIRAFAPTPGAFFELEGERYRVLAADLAEASGAPGTVLDEHLTIACGNGAIRPALIQRAGRPAMKAAELLRGRAIAWGTQLNS